MAHGVIRTDLMQGTDVRDGLVSVQYLGADGETPTAIDNGCVLKVEALKEGEREIYVGADVAANTPLKDVVIIASPEVMYDERLRNLTDFYNEAGKIARGYRFHTNSVFSVTKTVLSGAETPAVGDIVELAAGTKLNVVAAATGATNGSTVVGKIIAIDVVGTLTYYVIKIG